MMMRSALQIACFVLIAAAAMPTSANMRELERSELRENVRSGKSMSLNRLIQVISAKVDGEIVDVRGFEDGQVFYRVLIKQANGRVGVAIIEAKSGRFVSSKSSVVKNISALAKSNGNSASSSTGGNGNGNSGGNGNGNSGGNGNGNSGGNGNGNSGGNGNGNSGGNGNGNSGGGKK